VSDNLTSLYQNQFYATTTLVNSIVLSSFHS